VKISEEEWNALGGDPHFKPFPWEEGGWADSTKEDADEG
jgi:hypothetical protein